MRPSAYANRPIRSSSKLFHQLKVRHDSQVQQLQLYAPPLHRHCQFVECYPRPPPDRPSTFGLRAFHLPEPSTSHLRRELRLLSDNVHHPGDGSRSEEHT